MSVYSFYRTGNPLAQLEMYDRQYVRETIYNFSYRKKGKMFNLLL